MNELEYFRMRLGQRIAEGGKGSKRSVERLKRIVPSGFRPTESFVTDIREFALRALEEIATGFAKRHGKQKPSSQDRDTVLWLSAELKILLISPNPKFDEITHIDRTVVFAEAILKNPVTWREDRSKSGRDRSLSLVHDCANMIWQLAESERLAYRQEYQSLGLISRIIDKLRRREANIGWEKVLQRLSAILQLRTRNVELG